MTTKEKVAAALRSAKNLMNNSGAHWVRGDLRSRKYDEAGELSLDYSYCSLGAIFHVTGVDLDKIHTWDPEDGNVYDASAESEFHKGDDDFRSQVIKVLHDEIVATGYKRPHWQPEPPNPYTEWMWTITSWNDREDHAWDEIAEMFESAAKSAEQ